MTDSPPRLVPAGFSDDDAAPMRRALELAALGRGRVEPNPMVGAVLVRDGRVIGEGRHRRFGGPHAEVEALRACDGDPRGATLYVTLEPCCHHGKTPPCTDAVIAAGVACVIYAVTDPFPRVAGGGRAALRAAGIEVRNGLLWEDAVRLNAAYFKLLATGRPYVIAKWAMTLDGKLAAAGGDSKWISGEESRRRVHRLRDRVDAVLIGVGTALADDPLLTARIPDGRHPRRIVLDSALRLPVESQLVRTAREVPLTVVCRSPAPEPKAAALRAAGAEVLELPGDTGGRPAWDALLAELGRRRITNLLVEGGPAVLTSLLEAGLADEAQVFVAPKIIGGADAPTACGGAGRPRMADALAARGATVEPVGGDALITARFSDPLQWVPPES
jgi:diaminohydroxyphosphoribosylaminopyrimidine deaminase/5-amino-6-(5-phosphoribosylamino)uracil reductase